MPDDPVFRPGDLHRLRAVIDHTKIQALVGGHYGPPYTVDAYDGRDKSAAYRSIAYNQYTRWASALERILATIRPGAGDGGGGER